MSYAVYKHLNRNQHQKLEMRMKGLKLKMINILGQYGFVSNDKKHKDYLYINFSYGKNNISGNIGLSFQDIDNKSFKFGLSKVIDKESRRYFKSEILIENAELSVIDAQIHDLVLKAIELFKSWEFSDLELVE